MPSRSSRRKNASNYHPDHVRKLLQDGSVVANPSAQLLQCASELNELGIIDFREQQHVQCANPQDGDYPPKNRHCRGRITIDDGMDNLRCPDCERQVYPEQYRKQGFTELRSSVRPDGVEAFVQSRLQGFDPPPKRLGHGAFRVEVADEQVTLCVVELADPTYRRREYALEHRTVFLVVNDRDLDQHFLDEDWVVRTTLTEVICGIVDLKDLVRTTAAAGHPPSLIRQVSIPVCDRGPLAVVAEPLTSPASARRFVVEVGPNIVRIDGLKVVAEQSGPRFRIFRRLWEVFVEDLGKGLAPEKFRAVKLRELMRQIETESGLPYDDETSARRVVNRLQQDIETALRKHLGVAIGREDIVQTLRWQDQLKDDYGYRLNPFSVAVRPFQ